MRPGCRGGERERGDREQRECALHGAFIIALVAGGWFLVVGGWLLVRLVEFCRLEARFVLVSEQNAFKLLI
jgi:hypothetical protein